MTPTFRELDAPRPEDQLAQLQSLRPRLSALEFVFHDGDAGHPLADALRHLRPERTDRVGVRPGYHREAPGAVLHRYAYDRSILRTLDDLGGLFTRATGPRGNRVEWTALGNVDVSAYDATGGLLLYSVTHEGLLFTAEH